MSDTTTVQSAPQAAPQAAPQTAPQAAPQAAPQVEAPQVEASQDPLSYAEQLHFARMNEPMSVQEHNEAQAAQEVSEAGAPAPSQPEGEPTPEAGVPPESASPEAPITQEEFDTLPPKIQDLILELRDQPSIPTEWAPLVEKGVTPAALEKFMSDPVIEMRVQQLTGAKSIEVPAEVKEALSPDLWIAMAGDKIQSLDYQTDPEGTVATVKSLLETALTTAAEAGAAKFKIEAQQREQAMENKRWLESQIQSIASKNPALQSSLDVNDPAHPINPFIKHLGELYNSGMTMDAIKKMGVEGLWVGWQATQNGGFAQIYQKANENNKRSLLADLKKKAVQAHTTVGADTQSSNANPMIRHGIDGKRYLEDPAYRADQFDKALNKAQVYRDESLMRELNFLATQGRWPT